MGRHFRNVYSDLGTRLQGFTTEEVGSGNIRDGRGYVAAVRTDVIMLEIDLDKLLN